MKKYCIIFLTLVIITLTALGFSGVFPSATVGAENEYLRIHIRADSNDGSAQAVKYLVRDDVVDYLTPLVAEYETKEKAVEGVRAHLFEIAAVAARTLERNGFFYGATAELTVESFPTRVYGEYTLPAGEYAALILRLGKGEGDNWWCVVYPPLCFTGEGQGYYYKSKILDIINDFFKKEK